MYYKIIAVHFTAHRDIIRILGHKVVPVGYILTRVSDYLPNLYKKPKKKATENEPHTRADYYIAKVT